MRKVYNLESTDHNHSIEEPVEGETNVPTIPVIPDEAVPSEKGYHHGVHLLLYFHKEYGVDRKD